MRAVLYTEPNAPLTYVEDHPNPETPDAAHGTGLILDVTACGVCHSDIHVVDGDFGAPPPLVLGHEVTGVHPEMGPVMLYAPWGCKNCTECAESNEMICSNSREAGLFTDGGYADSMFVPDISYLTPLGDLDPYDSAPLACGGLTAYRAVLHGLDRLRALGANGRAAVIGAGGLGQYAIIYLRLLSEAQVTAVDLAADKQARAIKLGAHAAADCIGTDDRYDLIIDFIGVDATLTAAAGAINKLGTVAVVGLAGGTVPFGFGAVPLEARFLASVWGSRAQLDELLDLVRREPSILSPVEVLPLDQAETAHQRLRAGDIAGRVVLDIAGHRS